MIEKFTFNLQMKKGNKRLILVKMDSEQREHIVLKLIAYLHFHMPGLQIEADAGMHYKPDLVLFRPDGAPEIWIDCGYVSITKAESLARKLKHTKIIIVKQTAREVKQFRELLGRRDADLERLQFLSFEEGFISSLAAALERKNDVVLYPVHEDVWAIAMNDQIFESRFILE